MVHNGCVKVIAKGMKLKKDAMATFDKMKEDAQDICFKAEVSSESDE